MMNTTSSSLVETSMKTTTSSLVETLMKTTTSSLVETMMISEERELIINTNNTNHDTSFTIDWSLIFKVVLFSGFFLFAIIIPSILWFNRRHTFVKTENVTVSDLKITDFDSRISTIETS